VILINIIIWDKKNYSETVMLIGLSC